MTTPFVCTHAYITVDPWVTSWLWVVCNCSDSVQNLHTLHSTHCRRKPHTSNLVTYRGFKPIALSHVCVWTVVPQAYVVGRNPGCRLPTTKHTRPRRQPRAHRHEQLIGMACGLHQQKPELRLLELLSCRLRVLKTDIVKTLDRQLGKPQTLKQQHTT